MCKSVEKVKTIVNHFETISRPGTNNVEAIPLESIQVVMDLYVKCINLKHTLNQIDTAKIQIIANVMNQQATMIKMSKNDNSDSSEHNRTRRSRVSEANNGHKNESGGELKSKSNKKKRKVEEIAVDEQHNKKTKTSKNGKKNVSKEDLLADPDDLMYVSSIPFGNDVNCYIIFFFFSRCVTSAKVFFSRLCPLLFSFPHVYFFCTTKDINMYKFYEK